MKPHFPVQAAAVTAAPKAFVASSPHARPAQAHASHFLFDVLADTWGPGYADYKTSQSRVQPAVPVPLAAVAGAKF